jgi:hypothetical protein
MKFIFKNPFVGKENKKHAAAYLNTARFYRNLAESELSLYGESSTNYEAYCKKYAHNRNMAAKCLGFKNAEAMDIYNQFHENN